MSKYNNYSVLMSVYNKEKAEYLDESMKSIFEQTLKTNDFVLVCDGPLNRDLEDVIKKYQQKFFNILNIIRMDVNSGLGIALNEGLKHCKNEIVVRQDSDDISKKDRCEKEFEVFNKIEDISIISSSLEEFYGDINNTIGVKKIPTTYEEIIKYSRKRNPFNHPAVMFKKTDVLDVGSYDETYHFFEDYYLWIRLLQSKYKGMNIHEALVYMRVPNDFYKRRGGFKYAKDLLRFHNYLRNSKWESNLDFITGAIPHAIVSILPTWSRKIVYKGLRQ